MEESHEQPMMEKNCEIFFHALSRITTQRTLKISGYIKGSKVVELIESGNTHNFIDISLPQKVDCFIHNVEDAQVIVTNGGKVPCIGHCKNIHLTMGDCMM